MVTSSVFLPRAVGGLTLPLPSPVLRSVFVAFLLSSSDQCLSPSFSRPQRGQCLSSSFSRPQRSVFVAFLLSSSGQCLSPSFSRPLRGQCLSPYFSRPQRGQCLSPSFSPPLEISVCHSLPHPLLPFPSDSVGHCFVFCLVDKGGVLF